MQWYKYNSDGVLTKHLAKYHTSLDLGGGPLHMDLKTTEVKSIKTPIVDLISKSKTYGVFEL
mgnify:CR=1 FL=1